MIIMILKKKDMQLSRWNRILSKKYYSQPITFNNKYQGIASVSIIEKVSAPLTIHNYFGDVLIVSDNYKWMQVALIDQHFWLTVMFNEFDELVQLYFDISKSNHFENRDNPYFYDLFLDIVMTNNGNIYILDKEELLQALHQKIISTQDYQLALDTTSTLYNYLSRNIDDVLQKTNNLYFQLKSKII